MKYLIGMAGAFMMLVSCSENEFSRDEADDYQYDLGHIGVMPATRAEGAETGDPVSADADRILDFGFKENQSILYITQFNTGVVPDFSDYINNDVDNLYKYVYKPDPYSEEDATWNTGYNFAPVNVQHMLDWDVIRDVGSYGNGFTLYGMYFPIDNIPRFNVEADQRNLKNLQVSNIMGAYHATPSLYTRMRFRLHHLMLYMRLTLYVPVYGAVEEEDGTSNSGFLQNSLQLAQLLGVYPEIGINWGADRSSDTEGPLTVLNTNVDPVDVHMYLHPFSYTPEGEPIYMPSEDDQMEINIGDFVTGGSGTDIVYKYTFSVLIPAQPDSFTTGNFMKFTLRNQLGLDKNYYFSNAQYASGNAPVSFVTQGSLQQLTLYLPRKGSEAILVNANIINWTDATVDQKINQEGGGLQKQ